MFALQPGTWGAAGLTAALFTAFAAQSSAQQFSISPDDICKVEDASAQVIPAQGKPAQADMTQMANEGANHDHPARPVDPDLPVPSLTHLAFPDAMDGYNVQILAKNFTFTPSAINRDVVPNEGHAHIYINGVKITRVYGNWHHLPSSLFSPGVNALTVTLNANDHSTWATTEGDLIASTVPVIRPQGDP